MQTTDQFIASLPAGFLNEAQLIELVTRERLCLVLARFHQGRLIAPAQDMAAIIASLEKDGWILRDVSIQSDRLDLARRKALIPAPVPIPVQKRVTVSDSVIFNEADCGGAFDGRQVTSDADPGL